MHVSAEVTGNLTDRCAILHMQHISFLMLRNN